MRISTVALAGLLAFLGSADSANADDLRVVVAFKGSVDARAVTGTGGTVDSSRKGYLVAHVPPAKLAKLRADARVAFVEEDTVFEIVGRGGNKGKPGGDTSTPPPQQTPWGVSRVNAPLTTATGQGVTVAVVDSGIDADHPDLAGNVEATKSFLRKTDDDNGHGSHVAGTIAALDNDLGVVGVAPKASLVGVKVLDSRGSGWSSDVADGIAWAANQGGANIINLSLGSRSPSSVVTSACAYAVGMGALIIAAAGNDGDGDTTTDELHYPSALSTCVAVGATTSSDTLASFSSTYGGSSADEGVEVSAPGVAIPSTWKRGGYNTISGTSMAAPHAAGMAALLWAASTSPTNTAIRTALRGAVRDLGDLNRDDGFGFGVIDWQER